MTRKFTLLATLAAAALTSAAAVQADPIEREELYRGALDTCAGTEVIVARLKLEPGATVPRHSHNGDEHLVVLRGGTVVMPDGQTVEMPTGTTFDFPRDFAHGGLTASGDEAMLFYTVHVVDTGAPLNVAVK